MRNRPWLHVKPPWTSTLAMLTSRGECLRFRAAIRSNRVGGNRPFSSLDRREADLFPFAADLDTSATSTSFASMRFRFL